ncbi:hypothetical protein Btru_053521 [Bulinus truncatus]|nr:hypothetical protein Btru_053521 [Bulinus truncatus]
MRIGCWAASGTTHPYTAHRSNQLVAVITKMNESDKYHRTLHFGPVCRSVPQVMYTLFNTKSMWPASAGVPGQMVYSALPGTPMVLNPAPMHQPTLYYQLQPTWVSAPAPTSQSRPRVSSSDDVFLPDVAFVCDKPIILMSGFQFGNSDVKAKPTPAKKAPPAVYQVMEPVTFESHSENSNTSPVSSSQNSSHVTREHYITPTKLGYYSENSSHASSDSSHSSPTSQPKDDSMFHNLFPASFCAALNEDPPEPKTATAPLKTSSPINEDEDGNALFDLSKMRKRRGRFITSSSSEKCPRFSENGISQELDQCDKILMQSRSGNAGAEEQAKRREEFLLVLEAERERQKKLVLPKHTPKMSCKFCKNNGECPEVYTKHRLHYNEKTVCPLLRHYVCRLCNSTGDFAHTIRHCPFNDKKDKIAWRATFLV